MDGAPHRMFEELRLAPGLLTLRSAADPRGGFNAVIRPIVPLASRHAITLVFDPSNPTGTLTRQDEVCVIRCSDPAAIILEVSTAEGSGPPRGGVEIDYLVQSKPQSRQESASDYTVFIDRLGDRPGRLGAWVGGDVPGQAIAGIMIHHRSFPPRIMLQNPTTGRIAAPGEFLVGGAGFQPFSEIGLWIDDPDGTCRLHVTAEFEILGRIAATGTLVTLRGASASDRLLRLNLQLRSVDSRAAPAAQSPAASNRRNRVRIFRKAAGDESTKRP